MKKGKRKVPEASPIPETPKVEVIPPELKLKWDAIQAVATTFNMLDKGTYTHHYWAAVKESLKFVAKLHENMVEEALKHPQAHMIPELKEYLKEGKKEDGEKQPEAN